MGVAGGIHCQMGAVDIQLLTIHLHLHLHSLHKVLNYSIVLKEKYFFQLKILCRYYCFRLKLFPARLILSYLAVVSVIMCLMKYLTIQITSIILRTIQKTFPDNITIHQNKYNPYKYITNINLQLLFAGPCCPQRCICGRAVNEDFTITLSREIAKLNECLIMVSRHEIGTLNQRS